MHLKYTWGRLLIKVFGVTRNESIKGCAASNIPFNAAVGLLGNRQVKLLVSWVKVTFKKK